MTTHQTPDGPAAATTGAGPPGPPRAAIDLLTTAATHGWSCKLLHRADSDGNPFVEFVAVRPQPPGRVIAWWHTKYTGTWRYDSGLIGTGRAQDATLKAAREAIQQ